MIKTIIFDIGNVLADFNFEGCFKYYTSDDETYQKMVRATIMSPVWNEFDKGVWSDEEILQGFIKNDPSIERELRTMFTNLTGIIKQREYAIPWIRELKQSGYQVLLLSNFPQRIYEIHKKNELQFLDVVDGGILSYREKLVKPDPEIYHLLMKRYQLIPKECVFMDDREENVIAAREVGWQAIQFSTKEKALAELKIIKEQTK